jgi:hypothetical protein
VTWRGRALAFVVLLLLAVPSAQAQNCCMPRVKDDSAASNRLIEGIQAGTAVLILVPFSLVAAIAWRVYRNSACRDSNSIE